MMYTILKLNKSSKLTGIYRKHIICRQSDWVKYTIYINHYLIDMSTINKFLVQYIPWYEIH